MSLCLFGQPWVSQHCSKRRILLFVVSALIHPESYFFSYLSQLHPDGVINYLSFISIQPSNFRPVEFIIFSCIPIDSSLFI